MNLDYYRNFIAIVKAGSISEASRLLLIAQPALSAQVKALESDYGATLFNRGSRRIELTDAGKRFYNCAINMCYLEDSVRKEIHSCVKGESGTLRIGLTHATPDHYMEKLLIAFHERYPHVQFELKLNTSAVTADLLDEGLLDIGFLRLSDPLRSRLNVITTISETLLAYYTDNSPWIQNHVESLDISELKDVPLSVTIGLRDRFSMLCQEAGFTPYYLCTGATRNQVMMWCLNDSAVALLICNPRTLFQEPGINSCIITSAGIPLTAMRGFVTSNHRPLAGIAKTFLDFAENYSASPISN